MELNKAIQYHLHLSHLLFLLLSSHIYCLLSIQLSAIEWNDIVAFSHRIVHSCGRGIIVFLFLTNLFFHAAVCIDWHSSNCSSSSQRSQISFFISLRVALSAELKINKFHFLGGDKNGFVLGVNFSCGTEKLIFFGN